MKINAIIIYLFIIIASAYSQIDVEQSTDNDLFNRSSIYFIDFGISYCQPLYSRVINPLLGVSIIYYFANKLSDVGIGLDCFYSFENGSSIISPKLFASISFFVAGLQLPINIGYNFFEIKFRPFIGLGRMNFISITYNFDFRMKDVETIQYDYIAINICILSVINYFKSNVEKNNATANNKS